MALRSRLRAALLAGGLLLAGGVASGPALAAGEALPPPDTKFSFDGLFGTFDRASAQRGFQVYKEVCSNCHSMRLVFYRNLRELGLSDAEVRAIAALNHRSPQCCRNQAPCGAHTRDGGDAGMSACVMW